MAKGGETFRKRQRENKLREKAQLKRERRAQRRTEKKTSLTSEAPESFAFDAEAVVAGHADQELPG